MDRAGIVNKAGDYWETPLCMSVNSAAQMTHLFAGRALREKDSLMRALVFLLKNRIFGNVRGSLEVILPQEIFRLISTQDLQLLTKECGIRKFIINY